MCHIDTLTPSSSPLPHRRELLAFLRPFWRSIQSRHSPFCQSHSSSSYLPVYRHRPRISNFVPLFLSRPFLRHTSKHPNFSKDQKPIFHWHSSHIVYQLHPYFCLPLMFCYSQYLSSSIYFVQFIFKKTFSSFFSPFFQFTKKENTGELKSPGFPPRVFSIPRAGRLSRPQSWESWVGPGIVDVGVL